MLDVSISIDLGRDMPPLQSSCCRIVPIYILNDLVILPELSSKVYAEQDLFFKNKNQSVNK